MTKYIDPKQVKLALITLQTILLLGVGVHYASKALANYLTDELIPNPTYLNLHK